MWKLKLESELAANLHLLDDELDWMNDILYDCLREGKPTIQNNWPKLRKLVAVWRTVIHTAIECGCRIEFGKNPVTDGMYVYRYDSQGDEERFTYYPTTRRGEFIVKHPKYKGNKPLYRDPLSIEELLSILRETTAPGKGFRKHTSKGYRTKEQKKRLRRVRENE